MRTSHLALATLFVATLLSSGSVTAAEKQAPGATLPDLMLGNPTVKQPETAEAGSTLDCGDQSYHVTTGTEGGQCLKLYSEGKVIGMSCSDGNNRSSANCTDGCGNSRGAGDCEKK